MPRAAIFDVDGSLLDSVDLHALAWHEAMVKFDHDVGFEQVRGQAAVIALVAAGIGGRHRDGAPVPHWMHSREAEIRHQRGIP